ncbi:unnamed protein product [Callosobruchus maculatus]|uniref:Uncharacterized protein n=1 Tax=Callosobruchus maculatus TaxID=64391 RepID=A0A653CST9_CALMS|nr:unnamed protein product [Callosobruchus maculatus]
MKWPKGVRRSRQLQVCCKISETHRVPMEAIPEAI